MTRITLTILAAIALASAPAGADAASDAGQRVVALGDLHGDYDAYIDIVAAAGLVDADGHWSGGSTVFVQLGDVTDRGPSSRKIIEHLRTLDTEAEAAGGDVVVLAGNHEAMNVIGDLRYVHPGEYAAFVTDDSKKLRDKTFAANEGAITAIVHQQKPDASEDEVRDLWMAAHPLGKLEHRAAWAPGGDYGRWAAGLPTIAKIGNSLFVHGGISAEASERTIDQLNVAVSEAMTTGEAESILTDPLGPLWYRGNVVREAPAAPDAAPAADAPPPRPSVEEELALVLDRYGAERLVVAHTPRRKGIGASLGGRLVRIDTGISAHYGGPRTYLELVGGHAYAIEKQDGEWVRRTLPQPGDM
ncbi:metallophosphoesterase [Sphingomicrobium nitratireducens]|uniref:metallophosphoesterase n=1 Tax=Sphingomicrobium nitratireducens TaxID=2964666 RepID=UPI00223FE564|nr:metallophosphoesterase [Sphingomicrobium nitratireducens]